MIYFGQDGDLVVGKFAEFGCVLELLDVHYLHCKDLLVFAVLCLVYVAVLALTDLLEKDVVLYYLVHSPFCKINIKSHINTFLTPFYQNDNITLFVWVLSAI